VYRKMKPLPTPPYIKSVGYIRCNCNVGVPSESSRFVPLPRHIYVADIQIQTYAEITDYSDRNAFLLAQSKKYSEFQKLQMEEQRKIDFSSALPIILSYLPLGLCSHAAKVNSYWYRGTNMYSSYVDIRNSYPWQAFRPHHGQVDSILIKGEHVFTGGDKRIIVSNLSTGELLSMVSRDSGELKYLHEHDGELYCCSSNGSIRTFVTTTTGRNIKMNATMWDHSRSITHVLCDLPAEGPCEMHGISGHVCKFYSSSEDRTLKVWNITTHSAMTGISAPTLRSATFQSLAQSRIHLFAGTSTGLIAVFNKSDVCERKDVHACNIPGRDKRYCLQLTIHLPSAFTPSGSPSSINGLLCTGMCCHLMD